MKKMFGKLLIVAGVFIFAAIMMKDVLAERFSPLEGTEAESASASPHEINSMTISAENIHVHVIAEERNDISASITGKSGKLYVTENGKTLGLTAKEKGFQFLNFFHQSSLVVRVPYAYKDEILVRSSSGDIDLDGNGSLALRDLSAKSSSGNMTFKNAKIKDLEVKGSSGNTVLSELETKTASIRSASGNASLANVSGSLDVQMSSGNLNASFQEINFPASLKLASGNVKMSLPEKGDFTVNAATTSGNINPSYSFDDKNLDQNKLTGKRGSGKQQIEIKVTSGNVTIR
ncbi:DUF4097 domain-containing protein [Bacillus atrophaeus]|uniref:LiaG family protein n=1 Tax=Bacillus atrophaeus TaxID=1452 RepID=UPI0022823067|nr:DUF4097 domain-containing protein [Bacillus atrophaeus]MCY8931448.1 DUF4097 domain-containing protein [Bacillus atrophaeus]MCY8941960.1 DUF4097 domain-containing protein [Bacillus atrophaeus]MCY8947535.1 DUF4097 domain-containing protein [Bacillus atrophaeus]